MIELKRPCQKKSRNREDGPKSGDFRTATAGESVVIVNMEEVRKTAYIVTVVKTTDAEETAGAKTMKTVAEAKRLDWL